MSNKRFQDYLNQYSRHQIDSIHVDKFDMSKELGFLEDYFTKSCKVEKLQSMRQIEYKEVHSLQEQKQQKQIQQLEIKIQQLIKEQNDLENANKELYKDVKRQKYLIKSYQRDKIQFEKNKKVWDQKLIKMEEIYKTTQDLADNQKAVLSLINDDIDKQALIEAKRIKRT